MFKCWNIPVKIRWDRSETLWEHTVYQTWITLFKHVYLKHVYLKTFPVSGVLSPVALKDFLKCLRISKCKMTFRTEAGIMLLFLLYDVILLCLNCLVLWCWRIITQAGLCSWANLKQIDLIIIWTPLCVDLAAGGFVYLIWILKMIRAAASQMIMKSLSVCLWALILYSVIRMSSQPKKEKLFRIRTLKCLMCWH